MNRSCRVYRDYSVLALTASASCTIVYREEIASEQCQRDTDCASAAAQRGAPLVCRQHACQSPICSQNTECPSGSVCDEGLCLAPKSDGGTARIACTQDNDCGSAPLLCGSDGFCYDKWGCLDETPRWPAATASFHYVSSVRRIESPTDPSAVGPLTIEACVNADPTCTRPTVGHDQITLSSDLVMNVPFTNTLSGGFVGFLRITEHNEDGSPNPALPYYRHFSPENPLVGDLTEPIPVYLVGMASVSLLSTFAGVDFDPQAGFLGVNIHDCQGRSASGVSVTAPGVDNYVFVPISGVNGILRDATATTADGNGVVLNLPPNKIQTFALYDEELQRPITSSLNVTVYGAAINVIAYYPTYSAVQKLPR